MRYIIALVLASFLTEATSSTEEQLKERHEREVNRNELLKLLEKIEDISSSSNDNNQLSKSLILLELITTYLHQSSKFKYTPSADIIEEVCKNYEQHLPSEETKSLLQLIVRKKQELEDTSLTISNTQLLELLLAVLVYLHDDIPSSHTQNRQNTLASTYRDSENNQLSAPSCFQFPQDIINDFPVSLFINNSQTFLQLKEVQSNTFTVMFLQLRENDSSVCAFPVAVLPKVNLPTVIRTVKNAVDGFVNREVKKIRTAVGNVAFLDVSDSLALDQEFNDFKRKYGKIYASIEAEYHAKQAYIENRFIVQQENDLYEQGRKSYFLRINEYSDLLSYEFDRLLNGFTARKDVPEGIPLPFDENEKLPKFMDWRLHGCVTSVKNQGLQCQSCYAFSAAGAIECQFYLSEGILQDLSPQNIIDCSVYKENNNACYKGDFVSSFEYVVENNGIEAEKSYPYEYRNGSCRYALHRRAAHISGYFTIPQGNEAALAYAVAKYGPVSAAIDGRYYSELFLYGGHIYDDTKCKNSLDDLNHAILVVGYGVENDGREYWLIKNSYGPSWGENGYLKLAKFANNLCGIATFASVPFV